MVAGGVASGGNHASRMKPSQFSMAQSRRPCSRSSRCISSTSSAVSVIQMLFRVSWTWAPTVGSKVLIGFIELVFIGLLSS